MAELLVDSSVGVRGQLGEDARERLGARLRALRQMREDGFTATAAAAGIPATRLTAIESGHCPDVTPVEVLGLLRVLDSPTVELFDGAGDPLREWLSETAPAGEEVPAARQDNETGSDNVTAETPVATQALPPASSAKTGERGGSLRPEADARQGGRGARGRGARQRRKTDAVGGEGRGGTAPAAEGEFGGLSYGSVKRALPAFFRRSKEPGVWEIVYHWLCEESQMSVRVYTTISVADLKPRPVGTDALRVVVFDEKSRRKIHDWSRKLNRTGDAASRLADTLAALVSRVSYRPKCRDCRTEMRLVTMPADQTKQFWGCKNFPSCRYTEPLDGSTSAVKLRARRTERKQFTPPLDSGIEIIEEIAAAGGVVEAAEPEAAQAAGDAGRDILTPAVAEPDATLTSPAPAVTGDAAELGWDVVSQAAPSEEVPTRDEVDEQPSVATGGASLETAAGSEETGAVNDDEVSAGVHGGQSLGPQTAPASVAG